MFKRKLLTAAILSVTALSAVAAKVEPLKPYTGTLPAALQVAKTGGALEIFKKFPAAGNMDGWVVQDKSSGKNVIVFTSKDGEALVAGLMLDKAGKNLSTTYSEAHIPEPDYSEALAEFKSAPSVVVGNPKAKAELVIVFDANCGYCKMMHKLVEPAVKAGELKVHYIPVAILGADSDIKGAGLLASKSPAAALDGAAAGRAETSTDKALVAKVQANTELMKKHGFSGTPVVLYSAKVKGEQTVFVSPGVPAILEMFSRLGIDGQAEKLKQDPSLARFVR
jgi:thiol:disulfide interchange protein DsbG